MIMAERDDQDQDGGGLEPGLDDFDFDDDAQRNRRVEREITGYQVEDDGTSERVRIRPSDTGFGLDKLERFFANRSRFHLIRYLTISNSNLRGINEAVCSMSELIFLDVQDNRLHENSFPQHFHQLSKLRILNVSKNDLRAIPPEITSLESLVILNMTRNQIEEIPPDICKLQKLEALWLCCNRVEDIPLEIGHIRGLRCLALGYNQIQRLPPMIANLRDLNWLGLRKNQLTVLPLWVVCLEYLVLLDVAGNPLVAHFVPQQIYNVSPLQELCARFIKNCEAPDMEKKLPHPLYRYLQTARVCDNYLCSGVYFTPLQHVRFVDYNRHLHLPVLLNLCSPRCIVEARVNVCPVRNLELPSRIMDILFERV